MENLAQERKGIDFSVKDLTNLIYGPNIPKIIERWNILANDPVTKNTPDLYWLSRKQSLNKAYQKVKFVLDKWKVYDEKHEEIIWDMFKHIGPTPFDTHFTMFRLAIQALGSPKQRYKWLKLIKENKVIGCYAQTEIGHGSDVRNIETTAVYDKSTQEFIINSPTVSASKFWIGSLGLTANHCVVFAKLISDGNNYGVHPFIVQIRSMESHHPLKGITLGDIGPKLGWGRVDNGFLQLHSVRVPMENLLSKYGRIRRDGTYYSPPFANMRFFVMMEIRVGIIRDCSRHLAKALIIAARYCFNNTENLDSDGKPMKIIDYQGYQYSLIPAIANCYAIYLTSHKVKQMNINMLLKLRAGDLSYVKEMHSIASGLKSLFTSQTLKDIEKCREALGMHGYSLLSGLPTIYLDFSPSVTYEGDNTVLMLQCASFLLKAIKGLKAGQKLRDSLQYLNYIDIYMKHTCKVKSLRDLANVLSFEEFLRVRSCYVAKRTSERFAREMDEGFPFIEIFYERAQSDLIEMAKAHLVLFVFLQFKDAAMTQKGKTKKVLLKLCELYAAIYIKEGIAEYYECGFFTNGKPEEILDEKIEVLLSELRYAVIGLTDAFGYTDNALNSAFAGDKDGLETLQNWAEKSTFNTEKALKNFKSMVQPNFIEPKL
ncbi:unnamed protein product [Blepharisma stoltei]|uniref:Acyl-coenzyme A oxidase n=1 Tax=Blepharisma stoltei TaxID=1481888 RepID=A0AAU9IJ35_9CILI|nr:unnamed protein product [Blepharisma stoltei]